MTQTQNASLVHPRPAAAFTGAAAIAALGNGHTKQASFLLEQLAFLMNLLEVETVVADDFMPTEPAYRALGDE